LSERPRRRKPAGFFFACVKAEPGLVCLPPLGSSRLRDRRGRVNRLGPLGSWRVRPIRLGKTMGYGFRPAGRELRVLSSLPGLDVAPVESFLVSTGIVAIAEIGDKTQLLALLLAAKFRKPLPIIAGIFIATVANHAGAAIIGSWIAALIGPDTMRWLLAAGFVAMGIWVLIPDKVDDDEAEKAPRYGVLVTTVIAFFLLEMGDKTQIATIALAARYPDWWLVTMGTTFGMMVANVPAVLVGQAATQVLPLRVVHIVAALAFFVLGALLAADGIPHLLG